MRRSARRLGIACVLLEAALSLSGCRYTLIPPSQPRAVELTILAAMDIAPATIFPTLRGAKFGGVSALVYDPSQKELLGVSDDRETSRIFRLRVFDEPFRVDPIGVIPLERAAGAPAKLDPEGLVLLPNGHFLVSSEGIGNEEPHIPPGIIEYTRDGHFVRQLAVPPEFIPPLSGPITHGAPDNQSFEALALAPGGNALWTAEETALVQDGPAATAAHGSRSRLLRYRLENGTFVPDREFLYEVDPLPQMAGTLRIAVGGLVELLAVSDRELIAMERAYVENVDSPQGVNRLRLYRVLIEGTPITPGEDSIAGRGDLIPVTKTLLLDLGASQNLPTSLRGLDNFEGMATMPPGTDGRGVVILVSDDNFDRRQRTWFVKIGFPPRRLP